MLFAVQSTTIDWCSIGNEYENTKEMRKNYRNSHINLNAINQNMDIDIDVKWVK